MCLWQLAHTDAYSQLWKYSSINSSIKYVVSILVRDGEAFVQNLCHRGHRFDVESRSIMQSYRNADSNWKHLKVYSGKVAKWAM